MSRHSPVFKRQLVEKILSQRNTSIDEIAKEHGVPRSTAFRWLRQYYREANGEERRSARPQDWNLATKMKVLLETRGMRDVELGLYLRREGLYHCHLELFKQEVLDEVSKSKKENRLDAKEAILLQKVRDLQKELKIKDKALREATALLALKKKRNRSGRIKRKKDLR